MTREQFNKLSIAEQQAMARGTPGQRVMTMVQGISYRSRLAPKEVEVDGQRVTNHSLSDLTEADRYLASKKAMAGRHLPIRITKMAAGGAII